MLQSLKMASMPTLSLKSPNNIFIWYIGNLSNAFQFLVESVLVVSMYISTKILNVITRY
jgi:hypothetical protein